MLYDALTTYCHVGTTATNNYTTDKSGTCSGNGHFAIASQGDCETAINTVNTALGKTHTNAG